jgi:hypothetical protein
MLGEVLELSIAPEDGALPATLSAGSALAESGVSMPNARFKGAIQISARSRRRHFL